MKKLIYIFWLFPITLMAQPPSFTSDVYKAYAEQISVDYDTIYINPEFTGEPDGTAIAPYRTLNESPQAENTAYLIKRGTSYEATDHYEVRVGNVLIGAYGEGDRPRIIADGRGGLLFARSNVVVRDIEVPYIQFGVHSNEISHATAFNVKMRSSWVWARNVRFIGCEVSGASRNGIFIQQRDFSEDSYVEIAYTHIHKVNQAWTPDTDQNEASGDGVQISGFRGEYHIHNSIVDRSDTGNKFTIIINPHNNDVNPVSGLIENNLLRGAMPQPDGGAVIYIGNVQDATTEAHHQLIVRNNEMYGSTYDGVKYTGAAIFSHTSTFQIYGNYVQDVHTAFQVGGHAEIYDNEIVEIGEAVRYEYLEGEQVRLTAVPDDGWEFEKWIINGVEYTDNPITIEMNENTEVKAVFVKADVYYVLTLETEGKGQITIN